MLAASAKPRNGARTAAARCQPLAPFRSPLKIATAADKPFRRLSFGRGKLIRFPLKKTTRFSFLLYLLTRFAPAQQQHSRCRHVT